MPAHLFEPPAQEGDPPAGQASVGLELRLAVAARPDSPTHCPQASPEPLEVLPHPSHAREVVLELGELDLELALGATGMLGEDVEDQLRAVDDARRECILEVALLARVELVVDEERVGPGFPELGLELPQLSFPDVAALVRPRTALDQLANRLDSGGTRKLTQLVELVLLVDPGGQHGDDESPLRLQARGGIRLALSHD
jgi:hypothetical protein